jgi:phosphate transport system permease protein
MNVKNIRQKAVPFLLAIPVVIVIFVFIAVFLFIVTNGAGAISWELMTTSVLEDGIYEAIVGTFLLLGGTILIATPIGLATAIYLVEYAPKGRANRIITQALNNLAGVPSIVFGLFGYAFFAIFLGFGVSLLTGWLTLTFMVLPIIVRGSQEALLMVPASFKEAALALGATKWETIRTVVLPTAAPGLATSSILGMSRVAGETAAILFTCSVFLTRGNPHTIFDPVILLTYQLFVELVTSPGATYDRAYAMAIVLLMIVVVLNMVGYIIRVLYRKRMKW